MVDRHHSSSQRYSESELTDEIGHVHTFINQALCGLWGEQNYSSTHSSGVSRIFFRGGYFRNFFRGGGGVLNKFI
jgi:hypothetical protein